MPEKPRIALTPRSASHSALLEYWATLEGRSVADLCLTLLERAVDDALHSGRVPAMAVELMQVEMKAREAFCVERHGTAVAEIAEAAQEELDGLRPVGPGDRGDRWLAGIGGPGSKVGHYSSGQHINEPTSVDWPDSPAVKKGGK